MTTVTSIRQYVKVSNRQIHLTLPEGFDYEEVEVIVMPMAKKDECIAYWENSEIEMIGKVGQSIASFPLDDEEY